MTPPPGDAGQPAADKTKAVKLRACQDERKKEKGQRAPQEQSYNVTFVVLGQFSKNNVAKFSWFYSILIFVVYLCNLVFSCKVPILPEKKREREKEKKEKEEEADEKKKEKCTKRLFRQRRKSMWRILGKLSMDKMERSPM